MSRVYPSRLCLILAIISKTTTVIPSNATILVLGSDAAMHTLRTPPNLNLTSRKMEPTFKLGHSSPNQLSRKEPNSLNYLRCAVVELSIWKWQLKIVLAPTGLTYLSSSCMPTRNSESNWINGLRKWLPKSSLQISEQVMRSLPKRLFLPLFRGVAIKRKTLGANKMKT